jgi:hypothetical protein
MILLRFQVGPAPEGVVVGLDIHTVDRKPHDVPDTAGRREVPHVFPVRNEGIDEDRLVDLSPS